VSELHLQSVQTSMMSHPCSNSVGCNVGASVGPIEGVLVGLLVGSILGTRVGFKEGFSVGSAVGASVGTPLKSQSYAYNDHSRLVETWSASGQDSEYMQLPSRILKKPEDVSVRDMRAAHVSAVCPLIPSARTVPTSHFVNVPRSES